MIVNVLFKNPILTVGILMVVALYIDQTTKGKWLFSRDKVMPTSCRAVLVKLEKKAPAGWKMKCEENQQNLFIEITESNELTDQTLRPVLYRQLANHLSFIAKNSPTETLERVPIVRIKLDHAKLTINAIVDGKEVIKLQTLTSTEHIQQHLQAAVQVKETLK